jgi:HEPN domain-containing protein
MKEDRKMEAQRWLKQAKAELNDAAFLKDSGKFYLALFLCQQSAEKALKAFIYSEEDEPVFSHSVAFLLKLASSLDPEFQLLRAAKRLDDYYIPTRYPNGLPGETPSEYFDDENEVNNALELSRKIVDLSEKKIQYSSP